MRFNKGNTTIMYAIYLQVVDALTSVGKVGKCEVEHFQ